MNAITYLNNADEDDIRNTSILDKISDGTVIFYTANRSHLSALLKINDLRVLDYHKSDGVTKIRYRRMNEKGELSKNFTSYFLIA
jgi:hypothetical protein